MRFRGPVRPGDRLLITCKKIKARKGRLVKCQFQATVGDTIVVDGKIIGVPLPVDQLMSQSSQRPKGPKGRHSGQAGADRSCRLSPSD